MDRWIEDTYEREFDPGFLDLGLRPISLGEYSESLDGGIQRIIAIPPFKAGKAYRISIGLGLRVPAVEFIFRPDEKSIATVGMPLHLTKAEKSYQSWDFAGIEELTAIAPQVHSEISSYGLPFLQQFQKAEDVFNRLKSNDPDDWMMCTRGNRAALLVYFSWVFEGVEYAKKVADELTEEISGLHPKHRLDFDDAVDKLKKSSK